MVWIFQNGPNPTKIVHGRAHRVKKSMKRQIIFHPEYASCYNTGSNEPFFNCRKHRMMVFTVLIEHKNIKKIIWSTIFDSGGSGWSVQNTCFRVTSIGMEKMLRKLDETYIFWNTRKTDFDIRFLLLGQKYNVNITTLVLYGFDSSDFIP